VSKTPPTYAACDGFSGDEATDRILDHLPHHARMFIASTPRRNLELSTPRFMLRELAPSDFDALAALHADREHRSYVLPHQFGTSYIQRMLAGALLLSHLERRSIYHLAIVTRSAGAFAGICTVSIRGSFVTSAYLGWELSREFSAKGVAVETGTALIKFVRGLGVKRILADCDARNTPCISALCKLGMRQVRLRPWTLWAMRQRYGADLPYARLALHRSIT